jgi:peptide/nickel transport system substrate-binding protein
LGKNVLGNNVIIMKKGRIYALLAVLMVSAFAAAPSAVTASYELGSFSYGVGSLVVDLDPHYAWDSASIDTIRQVCEGLFYYNLSDPEVGIIPVLADGLGVWNAEATELTVNLKEGVVFHDGTDFTADDVVYSFDRLATLIGNGESILGELYEPLNGELVINETVAVSDYVVKFVLNYPYVPFVPLLCFSGSAILPEDEYPMDELMDTNTDDLIGTGPYDYISTTAEQTTLEAFEDWHGTFPTTDNGKLETIYFILYADADAKNQAFLSGQLDWLDGANPTYLSQFEADPDIYVGEQRQSTVIAYMGMNNHLIPEDVRRAISYAFNYEYMIEELLLGNAARLTTPVPEGIMFHNPDLDYPTFNLTIARTYMEEYLDLTEVEGYPGVGSATWWGLQALTDPLLTYNYTWNSGNSFRQDLGILVRANLEQIGIRVELCPMTWAEYLDRLYGEYDKLMLYMIGWGPDYNDPSNFINPLFSNTSHSNAAQVNDPDLQDMMMEGLQVTDPDERRDLYYDLQAYIVEDLMPWVFLYVSLSRGVWRNTVGGIQLNPMGDLQFSSMYWAIPIVDTDDTPSGIPGYSMLALLGAAAFAVLAIVYKKRH